MKSTRYLLLALALIIPCSGDAQVRLTDVVTFGADASGSYRYQPDIWETRPDGNFNNWIQSLPSGAFLNGPSDSEAQPNVTLSPGTNLFRICASPGIDNPQFGINLFFNDAVTPSISAFGPMLTNVAQAHEFSPDSGSPTPQPVPVQNSGISGAGTLSFVSGNQKIVLTDFYLATPSVFNLDQGGQTSLGADGVLDYVGGFTLVVTTNASDVVSTPSGLVGWWKGENNTQDSAGTNNGTWDGFGGLNTYASGKVGATFVFDGTHRDRVNVGNPENLQLQNLTIEAWIKRSSATIASMDQNFADGSIAGPGAYIFGYGAGGYGLFITDAGEVGLTKNSTGDVRVPPVITDANWHHVAVTKSGTSVVFYVDGIQQPSPGPDTHVYEFTTSAAIGSRGDGGGNTFYGMVDELSIYNRALSSNEITAIYHADTAGKCQPSGFTAYIVPSGTIGNQTLPVSQTQSMGNDFDVKSPIMIKSLGVFDSGGDGLVGTLVARIYNRDNQTSVASLIFTAADPGTLVGGSRFKNLATPLILPAGFHGICSVAYLGTTALEPDGNLRVSPGNWTTNDGGGLISFVGMGHHSFMGTGDVYPGIAEPAPAPNNFAAGTFTFVAANGIQPTITQQPADQTAFIGDDVSFSVKADGTAPLNFQWKFKNTNIVGATNQTLSLTNVQPGTVGIYSVTVSNVYGSVASSNALLTVLPPTNTAAPSGLVAWWKGEDNAQDSVGGNDGITSSGLSYGAGEVDQAFLLDNTNAYFHAPASPSLNVGLDRGFTIEAWIKPSDVNGLHPILEWNSGDGSGKIGVQFWIGQNPWSQGVLCAFVMDTNGDNYIQVPSPSGTLVANTWQHVATTYDRATHMIKVYVNGAEVAESAWNGDVPQTSYDLWVGTRPKDCNGCWTYGTYLGGPLDELSLYDRALSPSEIQAIYHAGSAGKSLAPTNHTPILMDVDFGGGGIRPSAETGPAAIGRDSSDFWNFYTRDDINGNWLTFGVLPNLKLVDGTVTDIGLTVDNAPGDWGNGSTDPMFNDYIYPFNGGNVTITVTNLPPGSYDLYAYSADSSYQVNSGEMNYGIRSTYEPMATNPPVWIEGFSYVRFTNVVVTAGQPLVLTALPLHDVANISGLQIVSSGTTNPNPPTLTCTPAPSGLVGWWKGDGNAMDSVGGNDGQLMNGTSFTNGEVAEAFNMNGASQYALVNATNSALDVGQGTGFTIEGWVYPTSLSHDMLIMEYEQVLGTYKGSDVGVQLVFNSNPNTGWVPGALGANIVDSTGNYHIFATAAYTAASNVWQHVALTYDKALGIGKIYLNGTAVAQANLGSFVPQTGFTNLLIGGRTTFGSIAYPRSTFAGRMDELSIYNRALTQSEIASIYNAGSAGKCPRPPIVLSVTPTDLYVNEGATAAFTVQATGSQILGYQWQHAGVDIPDATNSTLVLSNVVYSQSGNYDVVVSSADGWAVSSNVVLKVNRAPIADASGTAPLTVSPNAFNAVVVLNASKSSDADGDALTYAWFHANETTPIATGIVALRTLPVGTNELALAVDDGMAFSSQPFSLEVITTSQAVDRLATLIQSGSTNNQALIGSLEAALASIDHSNPQTAINQLHAFINKVQTQLGSIDPDLASQLIGDAQSIIDALNGGTPIPTAQVAITAITHDQDGRAHLKLKGACGCANVVETSTNMVDWVPVGVATQNSDGTYEFNDTQSSHTGMRFYRVVAH